MLTIDHVRSMQLQPVRIKDLPAFLAAIEPFARELVEGDIAGALMRQADRVIEATAIGAGIPRADLEDATPDVLIELAVRVVEVNADFFVRRLLPALTAAAERIGATLAPSSMTGLSGFAGPASATGT